MHFTKLAGCGNDFIIVDAAEIPSGVDLSTLGRTLCDRRNGIGADGLIVVAPPDRAPMPRGGAAAPADGIAYSVTIINAGGLPAEMCGNGARCLARYAHERGLAPREHAFATAAGIIRARVGPDAVQVDLTEPSHAVLRRRIELNGAEIEVDTIDTGVPHAVVWVEDVDAVDVARLGPGLRWHTAFQPRGVNANFAQVVEGGLALRTFERGVEAETLACGTGSAAAAILGHRRGLVSPPVRVRTRHGAWLTIDFGVEGDRIGNVRLIGPTTRICRGEVDPELLQTVLPVRPGAVAGIKG